MTRTLPIRVLLVDDHAVARYGARLMLSIAEDIEVRAEAVNADQAQQLCGEQAFDVALLDISMPGRNGLDLLKLLRAQHPSMAILMLSTFAEDVYAMRALKFGACGYLGKDCSAEELVAAVRSAAGGGRHISKALGDKLAGLVGRKTGPSLEGLSNRELEVLKLIAAGASLVDIGETLQLSPNTVTTYRSRLLSKLDLGSNAALTRYALEHGLI